MKKLHGFNPKIKDFLEVNPDITVMGIFWSGYWRLLVVVAGIYAIIGILSLILE